MKLYVVLAWVFFKELRKEFKKEEAEAEYQDQKDFVCCMDRALSMLDNALVKVKSIFALAIAFHREKEHGEKHEEEIVSLTKELEPKDIKLAARSWWKG